MRYFTEGQIESTNTSTVRLADVPDGITPYFEYDPENRDFLMYTIRSLSRSAQYNVWVLGFNRDGEGDTTVKKLLVAGVDPHQSKNDDSGDSSDLPAIIGGVIGGVVFLILIVLLIVWCSRRSSPTQSKFPVSYVEDALEYPPAQGQNLYAGVAKGKSNGYADSYPDVVNDGKGNGFSMRQTTNSFEESDKAYV